MNRAIQLFWLCGSRPHLAAEHLYDHMTTSLCANTSVKIHLQHRQILHLFFLADEDRKVLGVVSAYDVLALDCTPGQLDKSDGFFPPINR